MSYSFPQDIAALEAEHGPFLRSLARALVRDPGTADDLAQATWAAALSGPNRTVDRPRAWLSTILRRKAAWRVQQESLRAEDSLDPGETHLASDELGPLDTAAQIEREQLLLRAMEALREPHRTVIYLRYREGLGATEIAERTGTPVNTVRTRLHRGLGELRETLDEQSSDRRAWLSALSPLAFPGGHPAAASLDSPTHLSAGASIGARTFAMKTLLPGLSAVVLVCAVAWRLLPPGIGDVQLLLPTTGEAPSAPRGFAPEEPAGEAFAALTAAVEEHRPLTELGPGERGAGGPSMGAALSEVVTLTVKDASGAPAPGRSITLGSAQNSGRLFTPRVRMTDADGAIEYEGLGVGCSYYAKDSLGHASSAFTLASGGAREFELTLKEDIEIVGRVVDESGGPVAGAAIWSGPTGMSARISVRFATSDPDGSFSLHMPVDGMLQATLPGFVASPLRRVVGFDEFEPGRLRGTLTLREAGPSLRGVVVDIDGQPVPGAAVIARSEGGAGARGPGGSRPVPVQVWADAEGRFESPCGLSIGTWSLLCQAEGYATERGQIEVTGEPIEDQRIELGVGVMVSGCVYLADGTPAAGAYIGYEFPGADFDSRTFGYGHKATSGSDGSYALLNVPLGPAVLQVRGPLNLPLERVLQPIDIAAAEDQVVRIDLSDEPFIAGHVVGQDGQPMAGVEVYAKGKSLNQHHLWGVLTDANGAFRLTSLQPGADGMNKWDLAVRLTSQSFVEAPLGSVSNVEAGEVAVTVQAMRPVPKTAFIEGRFEGVDGFIPSSLEATAWRLGVNHGRSLEVAAESGAFRYGPVAPGTFSILGYVQEEELYRKSGIVVGAGETVDVGVLRAGAGGHACVSLNLTLPPIAPVDEVEAILRNVSVTMSTEFGGEEWLDRDGDHWVTDDPIEPGTWRVKLDSSILIAGTKTLEIVDDVTTDLELDASFGRSLRVKLELPALDTWSTLTVKSLWPDGSVAAESEPIERAGLSNPSRTFVKLMAPIGSVRFVVETDTDVAHDETIAIPAYPARFRRITLSLD